MTAPRIDRPEIPAEYGIARATAHVDWSHVEERLGAARVYWIATVGAGGRPRVRPVDGMYVDGVIYVGGSPETRWVRDVAANPHVSVHLDTLEGDVVIVEGDAEVLQRNSDEFAERLAAASKAKYPEYGMTAAQFKGPGPIAIRPRKVVAWTDFMKDPTRFRFD
jgi:nitroimidazol reductase NimA-like FMN-containing flavoprotein (pyridoxamine 5'-phosphate oxidase superfamily)